jgi:hydroxypyruvate reductase
VKDVQGLSGELNRPRNYSDLYLIFVSLSTEKSSPHFFIAKNSRSRYALLRMAGKITGLRGVAEAAFNDALLAADPEEAVHRHFRLKGDVLRVGDVDYFLSQFRRVFVIGAGKASLRMAQAVERIMGNTVSGGLVITTRGQSGRLRNVLVRHAGHPVPDQDGVRATEEMLEFAGPFSDRDLVVCVLSGGGSSLMAAPIEGVSIADLQRATNLFLASGMTIAEINTVRKHLSRVNGGRLAERLFPATIITLILSDVIGDRPDVIASGPTAPDPTTFHDAVALLNGKGLWDKLPENVRKALSAGERGELPETPKPDSEFFRKVHHLVVGSNSMSVVAAERRANRLGMNTMILSSSVAGESREIAQFYAALAREIRQYNRPVKPPACLIAGGETTVTMTGQGRGGRCQELALALADKIEDVNGVVFLAAGTDGVDGSTDAAGAICDSSTMERARAKQLDPREYLVKNDSNTFFAALGDLVTTGPTGTNVMDIHILLVG